MALVIPSGADRATPEEVALIDYHLGRLFRFRHRNKVKEAYYEGRQRVKNLGVTLPPALRDVDAVVGWPATAVDVLEERLDFQGWAGDSGDALGLDTVYTDNGLDVDSSLGHLDALIAGTGFVVVGKGAAGDPDVLVTVESPNKVTGEWDGRTRRLASALSVDEEESGDARVITLYLPNENVRFRRTLFGWVVEDRDVHNFGRVTVVMLPNKPRASRVGGRSEITRALRGYTDAAVRTLLGMDVHREFYQAPQRYLLGAEEHMFKKADGTVATGWESVMGRMLAIPRDEDGELPQIGQFNPASPTPYLEQVRGLSQLVSAEASIPPNYLGFSTDNPPSADAIRAMEARLIKRAERRQAIFGRAWREVGALALLTRDGEIPDGYRDVRPTWRDAATPTRSAAADEVTKYVGAGILPPDSEVTYDRMGLAPGEKRSLRADQRRARMAATAAALMAAPGAPAGPEAPSAAEDANATKAKADALGALIRAGVDPDDAARRVGLGGLTFTGAMPVSLRLPEHEAEDLEEK